MAVIGWDSNPKGELMTGYAGADQVVPVASVIAPPNAVELAASYHFTVVRDIVGAVWTVGGNQQGELGQGDNKDRTTPTKVVLPESAVEIAAGGAGVLVRLKSGKVASWGADFFGQIGNGTKGEHQESFGKQTPIILDFGQSVVSISAGGASRGVVLADGSSKTWGENQTGQLGVGDHEKRLAPTNVTLPSKARKISMGGVGSHGAVTLWLLEDGSVYGAGAGEAGQFGGKEHLYLPTKLNVPHAVDVAAARSHTLVLDTTGKVSSLGSNENGELGRTGPNPVPLDGVTAIAASMRTSIFIAGGKIYTVGLTNGRETDEALLEPLDGVTGASRAAIGEFHAVAITNPIPAVKFTATEVVGGADLEWDIPAGNTEKWLISIRPVVKPKKAKWGPAIAKLGPTVSKYPLRNLPSGKPYQVQLINHGNKSRIITITPK